MYNPDKARGREKSKSETEDPLMIRSSSSSSSEKKRYSNPNMQQRPAPCGLERHAEMKKKTQTRRLMGEESKKQRVMGAFCSS